MIGAGAKAPAPVASGPGRAVSGSFTEEVAVGEDRTDDRSSDAATASSRGGDRHDLPSGADLVVIGAGSAGSAFAARLAERPGRTVLLVEAGPDPTQLGGASAAALTDASTLVAAYSPTVSAGVHVDLGDDRSTEMRLGRVVGGSGAVNGAYFLRGRPVDFDRWAARGNLGWSAAEVQCSFERLEHDLDLGDRPGHGDRGPVPVQRELRLSGVTDAFFAACEHLGHVELDDLNGPAGPTDGDRPGCAVEGAEIAGAENGGGRFGVVPRNARGSERVGAATAYFGTRRTPPGPLVIAGRPVRRVLLRGGRATGVELVGIGGVHVVEVAEVVLSAGALGSPELLRRSGIGPADELRAAGIEVVHDAPGLGTAMFDHPCIDLMYRPGDGVLQPSSRGFFQGALHFRSGVEILATRVPYGVATGRDPGDELLSLRVTLMRTSSRGRLHLRGTTPPGAARSGTTISYGSLATADDRALARVAVRAACSIAVTPAFGPLVAQWFGPETDDLCSDDRLDAWIRAHLGTAFHPCGTAPMGRAADPLAVVDEQLRVHGIEGLRVVDTSIVPEPLSRGPAATAIMIGEHAAAMFPDS